MKELIFDLTELQVGVFYQHEGKLVRVTEIANEKISVKVIDGATSDVQSFDEITIDELQEKLNAKQDNKPIKHKMFDKVMSLLKCDRNPYLFGPAGTGKNVLCKQLADELGLTFYYANAVTQEFALTGYGDANGKYVETEFYRAFTKGGLFFIDELDASCPEALTVFNVALANRYFAFPVIGRVDAHPDFKVIAAGNSCGRGADEVYTARQAIDGSTMNRFDYIKIEYDERIEHRVANHDNELVSFIHDLRQSSKKASYPLVLSYRNISGVADLRSDFTLRECMEMCITKGMGVDEISILHDGLQDKMNKFAKALKELTFED